MLEIKSQGPVNRHITEYLTTTPGVKQYKCKTLQNPDYFYNGQIFAPVDVVHKLDISTEKAGEIWLRDKAIVSVGTKKADDAYKLFGLRPDENQGGSESVEWSVESIEVNGKPQTINLRDRVEVSPITTKFGGNLYIQRARQRCRVMVAATNADDGFRIALRLHLKGLTPVYRADLDEWWIFNDKGQFRFRLGKPYLIDPSDMNPLRSELDNSYPCLVKHTLTEISKGEYVYIKEPTEAFGKVTLPVSFLIDADTVYSSTADGYVYKTSADWASLRAATSGTMGSTNSNKDDGLMGMFAGVYYISRCFFYYSLASLSGIVSAVTENIYGFSQNTSASCTQLGTQADTLEANDFDNFIGNLYASVSSWSKTAYNVFTYNAQGIIDIQSAMGGSFKTCARDHTYDYQNSTPTGIYLNGVFFADDTSGTKDPYLYITTAAANLATLKTWGPLAKAAIKTIDGIPLANIKTWGTVA